MEIITGVERRRRWSLQEKLRIVAETEQPGSGIAEIARRCEISRGLPWNWRARAAWGAQTGTASGILAGADDQRTCGNVTRHVASSSATGAEQVSGGKIEITLPDGTSIKVGRDVGLVTLQRVMRVLRR